MQSSWGGAYENGGGVRIKTLQESCYAPCDCDGFQNCHNRIDISLKIKFSEIEFFTDQGRIQDLS